MVKNNFLVIIGFVALLAIVNISFAQAHPHKLQLLVIDKATKKPLANQSVSIYSDNGIRCIQAPCPTNGKNWKGKTDKHGNLTIPNNIRQASMTIEIAGYGAEELNRSARKVNKNSWVIMLERQ